MSTCHTLSKGSGTGLPSGIDIRLAASFITVIWLTDLISFLLEEVVDIEESDDADKSLD